MVLGHLWVPRLTCEEQRWLLYAAFAWQALGRLSLWALQETCIAVVHLSMCMGGSGASIFVHRNRVSTS